MASSSFSSSSAHFLRGVGIASSHGPLISFLYFCIHISQNGQMKEMNEIRERYRTAKRREKEVNKSTVIRRVMNTVIEVNALSE